MTFASKAMSSVVIVTAPSVTETVPPPALPESAGSLELLSEHAARARVAAIAMLRRPARRSADRLRSIRKGVLSTKKSSLGVGSGDPIIRGTGATVEPAGERSAGRPIPALGGLDADRQLAGVVGEVTPPPLSGGTRDELVADLDRVDRVVVERTGPAHRNLPPRRDEVAPHDRALGGIAGAATGPFESDKDRLRSARMATGAENLHPWDELDLAVHLGQLSRCADGVELRDLHDPLDAELVSVCRLGLVALHDVASVRKCRPAGRVEHPAGMVVMEMRDHDEVD